MAALVGFLAALACNGDAGCDADGCEACNEVDACLVESCNDCESCMAECTLEYSESHCFYVACEPLCRGMTPPGG